MGSWNATCGVTQLSISADDPIMLFFLVGRNTRKTNHDGFFSTTGMWAPKYLPIQGVYDDYGGISDVVENYCHSYLLHHIKHELVQARLSSSAYNGISDDPVCDQLNLDDVTIEGMLKEIGRNRLWLPGVTESIPVGVMMVHSWVWDHLTVTVTRDWQGDLSLQQVQQQGRDYYQSMREITAKYDSNEMQWRRTQFVPHTSMWSMLNGDTFADSLGSNLHGLGDLRLEFEYLSRAGKSDTHPQVTELIDATSCMLVFNGELEHLRKMWMPQNGLGSTRCNQQAHQDLAQLVAAKTKERLHQQEQRDLDWGDARDHSAEGTCAQ